MNSLLNYIGHKSKIVNQIKMYLPETVIELAKKYRKWASAGNKTVERGSKINREVLVLSYRSPIIQIV